MTLDINVNILWRRSVESQTGGWLAGCLAGRRARTALLPLPGWQARNFLKLVDFYYLNLLLLLQAFGGRLSAEGTVEKSDTFHKYIHSITPPCPGWRRRARAGQVRHLLFYCHEFCCNNACVRELLAPGVVVAETVCRACGREAATVRVAVGGGRRGAGDGQRRAAPPPPQGLPAHRRPQPASPRP